MVDAQQIGTKPLDPTKARPKRIEHGLLGGNPGYRDAQLIADFGLTLEGEDLAPEILEARAVHLLENQQEQLFADVASLADLRKLLESMAKRSIQIVGGTPPYPAQRILQALEQDVLTLCSNPNRTPSSQTTRRFGMREKVLQLLQSSQTEILRLQNANLGFKEMIASLGALEQAGFWFIGKTGRISPSEVANIVVAAREAPKSELETVLASLPEFTPRLDLADKIRRAKGI